MIDTQKDDVQKEQFSSHGIGFSTIDFKMLMLVFEFVELLFYSQNEYHGRECLSESNHLEICAAHSISSILVSQASKCV